MKNIFRIMIAAMLPVFLLTGCDEFLDVPDDPNRPTQATTDQLFVASQAAQFTLHTGHLARVTSMWMQQMAGTDRQYQTLGTYGITEADFSPQFSSVYSGGGLIDLRAIQNAAELADDRVYAGIAKVWEAFTIGMAASMWGGIPYSQAVDPSFPTPELDEQTEVYASVQQLLDEAIADLQSGQGDGPGTLDLVFGGDPELWIDLAHTIKARFYLHLAELDASNYGLALEQAEQGIASPLGNFNTAHTANAGDQNIWFQFFRDRDSYMRAGEFFVQLLKSRNDPRLGTYFAANENGSFEGAAPGEGVQSEHSLLDPLRAAAAFSQPLVTWSENMLIIAEAAFETGDENTARMALNQVRDGLGLQPVTASGDALLQAIMLEKYIVLFQNIESWNDYKRTCVPDLEPAGGATNLPARLLYGEDERNANPNIPAPAQQPVRNDNDPQACN